jgi:hypothetical protein
MSVQSLFQLSVKELPSRSVAGLVKKI